MKNILFASSECVPFIKTGGLADVVGSLPKEFDKEKYDVRVVIPKYTCMKQEWKDRMEYVTHFYMDIAGQNQYVGVMKTVLNGITFYFIDNEHYFSGFAPYDGDPKWGIEKFAFFSKAVLSILPVIGFRPDLIHCHDWQTGLIPVYLDNFRYLGEYYRGIKTIMTIHNLKFQGVWDTKTVRGITGLPEYYFVPDKMEAYKDANLLKGGIVYADKVTTVSQSYAEEIKTPFYGEGLDGLMSARSNDLCGIVNGLDYDDWNPATDPRIAKNFTIENFRKNKPLNKLALQEELGLNRDQHVMMIGIVSRLTDQKGFDLIDYVMDELCQDAVQIVVLGTGDVKYENMFRHFAWKYGGRVSANIYYSDELSHKIYASCDAFLMPSLFEPCGLSQLMSLRYGTLPIVRETGGLKDTVEAYNEYEKTGTGFSFCNYNAHEMLGTIRYAERIYYDRKRDWNKIVERAMSQDFSWKNSARQYEDLYRSLIGE
ncbi:starch synthase [Lachnoclostridium sp. An169]|uniref:glycogen synthase GlgA n=1 Tax=Lachnoclostridium sp. An169 TaxID=1965569 RepID=UPI000B36A485|nr:glycogen synthase GlgA [Lachnoclostridium sp. An169]OUP84851.1 starch synthase [Lachnoclostridium sp. An169]HJA67503.1 glycogen synthase GlgA [Candidatus Mediterraneibacter cottocaccae]